jgi:hypothetical protein
MLASQVFGRMAYNVPKHGRDPHPPLNRFLGKKEMDRETFWKLIDAAGKTAEDCDAQSEALIVLLAKYSPDEVVAFEDIFRQYLNDAYRWDLWAVAYIINGGCSDDGFEFFRGWLIAQGQEYFEAALANPALAASKVAPGDFVECESILYAASEAFEQSAGKIEMGHLVVEPPAEPAGERWEEKDLIKLFPKLVRKFSL